MKDFRFSENKVTRQVDNDLLCFHGDAAASAVDDAAANYQSPSIIASGIDAHGVSVVTTLINLSLALVCLKTPALIEKAGLARRGAIILAFLNLCAWVPLILAFLFSRLGIAPGWLALLWFVNLVPGLMLSVQRDNWLSNLVPQGMLGRYLGQRLAIKSAFYLGAFCFLGFLMDRLGKENLAAFAVVFTIAILVAFADFVIFTFMGETKIGNSPTQETEKLQFGLLEYLGELKEKKLNDFIAFTSFFYLTVGLSGPLYAVYVLRELHFSYLNYTVIVSAEFLARVVSVPFWGRFADKVGNIRVLGIVSRVIPMVPILWLFGSHTGYLVFVQALSGTCWGAFDLCTQSYLYKVAPAPKKLRYIIYTRCLVLLCTAAGGLLGAFCVNGIFPTFGSRILSVFWLSGLSRAVVVLYMMPRLVDLALTFGKPPPPPRLELTTLPEGLPRKRGQFYRRQSQTEPVGSGINRINKAAISGASKPKPNPTWVAAYEPQLPQSKPALQVKAADRVRLRRYRAGVSNGPKEIAGTSNQRLLENLTGLKTSFSRDQLTASEAVRAENLLEIKHREQGMVGTKIKSRPGLYHDKVAWGEYMKETLAAILQERLLQKVPASANTWGLAPVPVRIMAHSKH